MTRSLFPLFFIAAAAVGVEIGLTRFFAVASWSEYGYWVISIAMSGFAVSGVVMVLGRTFFLRQAGWLLPGLPLAMLAAGAIGWVGVADNAFNPLELQNPTTAGPQLWNIALYYAALFPFFFLAGLAVSLNFVVRSDEVGRVYGYDLLGAGAGAAGTLAIMYLVHPFFLLPALLPLLALAAWIAGRRLWRVAALGVLAAAEAVVFLFAAPQVNQFKPIYAPLNVPDSMVVAEIHSPRGVYQLLDNFTERLDAAVSFNASLMGAPPPPRSYGLYRDGARVAALPIEAPVVEHADTILDGAPYVLLEAPRVLSLGGSGGFRAAEALALGASHVTVVEPEPVLHGALTEGLGPSLPPPADPRIEVSEAHPLTAEGEYDLIDVAGDFLMADDANRYAYTAEALAGFIEHLAPGGLISIPVSIRELPVYASRLVATAREALLLAGVADPAAQVAVIRSAWNLRVLIANEPLTPEDIARLVDFADERSFDLSYAPGHSTKPEDIWNDLPPIRLESQTLPRGGPFDAVADEVPALLAGDPPVDAFDRTAITADRPWMSPLIKLSALPIALERIELLPQSEIGLLVNIAVLSQAAILALIVSLLPVAARGALRVRIGILGRALIYFPALGLGFLIVEIAFIEYGALILGDRTSSFALVLTTMLVGSGIGSMLAARARSPRQALMRASAITVVTCILALLVMETATLALLELSWTLRTACFVLAIVPLSIAMGFPFPLGLDRFQQSGPNMLPWAWALNGAFSVVATPLASLMGHGIGLSSLMYVGAACYVMVCLFWPRTEGARR